MDATAKSPVIGHEHAAPARPGLLYRPTQKTGLMSWLTTVDHKRIGFLYGISALFFFLVGGVEALLIRLQLMVPNNNLLTAQQYNTMFTMHGTTMIFLAIMPMSAAFFNYIMPLQIGAPDVAFPRLHADPLAVSVLGVRPSRGVHPDPARDGHHLGNPADLLAQAPLRLPDRRLLRRGHRLPRFRGLEPSHVHHRHGHDRHGGVRPRH